MRADHLRSIRRSLRLFLATGLLALLHAPVYGGDASPVPLAGQSAASPTSSLRPGEAKQLQKEFIRSQKTALEALDHRQDSELQAFKSAQKASYREWMEKEKVLRHQFFAEHSKGVDQRAYMKSFADRRDAFLKAQSDDLAARKKENKDRIQLRKKLQESRLKAFQDSLSRGERPAADLWPTN